MSSIQAEPPHLDSLQIGTPHLDSLQKGFQLLALAATFVAAIQTQVMTISINIEPDKQTILIYVVNSLFLSSLILAISAACLAFLTSRWLQRLETDESAQLEEVLNGKTQGEATTSLIPKLLSIWFWFALSLFIGMPLLVVAVAFMIVGIMVYIWSEQHLSVAIVTSIALAIPLPFMVGIFCIGRDQTRRQRIISHLGGMQGDW